MKTPGKILMTWVLCGATSWGGAATLSGFKVSDALTWSDRPNRWTAGANAGLVRRDVKLKANDDVVNLRAEYWSGYLGYAPTPWLSLHGTAGQTKAKLYNYNEYGSWNINWSLGAAANYWQVVDGAEDPLWKLTFKFLAQYGQDSSGSGDNNVDWQEYFVATTANYEFFFKKYPADWTEIHSVIFYAGPALSVIDGRLEQPGFTSDFEQKRLVALVAGADVCLSDRFSVGAWLERFEDVSVGLTARYLFQ